MGWEPPDDDGGAPIRDYNVKEQRKGAQQTCGTNSATSAGSRTAAATPSASRRSTRSAPASGASVSEPACADTEPGRVENIRMVDRGDGTITVAWDKPRTQTSKVLDYTVTWLGGQQTVSGDRPRFAVPGLDNNEKYTFTVKALNKVGFSAPRTSDQFQPLGTPRAPGRPAVTDLESGADQTGLRVAWPATLPEGPGPTLYTVSYTTGRRLRSRGARRSQATTLRPLRRPLRRRRLHLHRRGPQPPGEDGIRAQPSAGTFQAVGRPAAWGAWSVARPATTSRSQLQYTVPGLAGHRQHGRRSWSAAWSSGRSRSRPGAVTTSVPTPSNERPLAGAAAHVQRGGAAQGARSRRSRTSRATAPSRAALGDRSAAQSTAGRSVDHHRHQQRRRRRTSPVSIDGGTRAGRAAQRGRVPSASPAAFTDRRLEQDARSVVTVYDDTLRPGGARPPASTAWTPALRRRPICDLPRGAVPATTTPDPRVRRGVRPSSAPHGQLRVPCVLSFPGSHERRDFAPFRCSVLGQLTGRLRARHRSTSRHGRAATHGPRLQRGSSPRRSTSRQPRVLQHDLDRSPTSTGDRVDPATTEEHA